MRGFLCVLTVALILYPTSCSKDENGADAVKKVENDEIATELAIAVYWTLNSIHSKIPN